MSELTKLTLTDALIGLDKGDFSAVELTQAFVDSIANSNGALNAYVVETPEQALAMAAASDERRAAGTAGRPSYGHQCVEQVPSRRTARGTGTRVRNQAAAGRGITAFLDRLVRR